jgi:hypothetical protein
MFTICSFNSPDLDGYQGTRENKNVPPRLRARALHIAITMY